jgi:peroxiredoxin
MHDNSATDAHRYRIRLSMWMCLLLWPIGVGAVERGDLAHDFTLPLIANATAAHTLSATTDSSTEKAQFALLKLSDYRGKVVYLDFWQSSCLPCRESMPLLSEYREEFLQHDVEIVAVNTDANPRDALAFVDNYPVSYPVVSDPGAQVARAYGLKGLPTAYLIDRDGTVQGVHEGFKSQDIAQLRASLFALSGDMGNQQRPAPILPASITMIGD